MKCISTSEVGQILAGCKRIEKENLRHARYELQQQFSILQVGSSLSAMAQPFQPRITPQSSREDNMPRSSPAPGFAPGSPLRRTFPSHHQSSDDDGVSTDTTVTDRTPRRRRGSRRSHSSRSGSDFDSTRSSGGRRKKKDGFSSKIQIPEFGGKKGHTHDVAGAFWQWAHCITYYRDYYEDSYLMPLVVSSLMGDASDVFDWILSLTPGNTQDLTTLLQMLREHYCVSLTFREQRNTIENLRQKPQEAAIDFLIRVGTSVSNLGKDWKDELTDKELQSLQYEVSMNGVHEEIRHVLDSEIAKNGGRLTPQPMYEAVKRYKTYVAHNKRLEGKGASSSTTQPKATGQTSGYKPRFHKIMAFSATIPEVEDNGPSHPESSPLREADTYDDDSSQEDDEGLYIPSYLEEAIPDDPVLQVKMAHAMLAQEVETRRCFTCNQPGLLQRDHWKYEEKTGMGPCSQRGLPKTSRLQRRRRQRCLPWAEMCLKQISQDEEGPLPEPRCIP